MKKRMLTIYAAILITLILACLLIPDFFPMTSKAFKGLQFRIQLGIYNFKETAINLNDFEKTSNEKSELVIIFDDGYESVYINAYPLLKKHGSVACIGVIGNRIGEQGYMTLSQLSELYREGYDILNHSFQHVQDVELSREELIKEYRKSMAFLKSRGFARGYDIILPPGGEYLQNHLDIALESGFRAIRSLDKCYVTGKEDATDIVVINVYGSRSIPEVKSTIDDSIEEDKDLIIIFHKICLGESESDMYVSLDTLASLISHIEKAQIDIVTFSDLLDQY